MYPLTAKKYPLKMKENLKKPIVKLTPFLIHIHGNFDIWKKHSYNLSFRLELNCRVEKLPLGFRQFSTHAIYPC